MKTFFTSEKHYNTLNNYLKERFLEKVYKISLNAGFTCPNRDGKIDTRGCLYCSALKSGDFAGRKELSLREQFLEVKNKMKEKWEHGSYIAYFQAGTNTYAPLSVLERNFKEAITLDPKIKILSIATRPDCIDEDIITLLKEIKKDKEVWVELGFQTVHESTSKAMNRGYANQVFEKAVNLLHQADIPIIVHIINGLPNESKEMMLETIKYLNHFSISGIKIHMLHLLKETALGNEYLKEPFPLLSLDEFVDTVVFQLRLLRPDIIVHRLTGDAPKDLLIAPNWTLKKFIVLNEIDKMMRKNNLFQGDLATF